MPGVGYITPADFSDDFKESVNRRHRPNSIGVAGTFSSDEVAAMSPKEHAWVLDHAATIQRGVPESTMLQLQKIAGGGLYQTLAEHIGDITFRLNEQGGNFGINDVDNKVRRALNSLTHPYGFEREHMEQMRSNGTDMNALRAIGEQYANAHRLVPIYNHPSLQGNYAAIDFGHMRFSDTTTWLQGLQRTIENPAKFAHQMSQAGTVEFLRKHEDRG